MMLTPYTFQAIITNTERKPLPQTLLPENLQKCEVKTIRRVILKIPGNVVGSGRYQHIRLASCFYRTVTYPQVEVIHIPNSLLNTLIKGGEAPYEDGY